MSRLSSHAFLQSYLPDSESGSEDSQPAYSDNVLQEKSERLRRERRRMKKEAVADLRRLQTMAGVKHERKKSATSASTPSEETKKKSRREIEKEVKVKQDKEKQERKERLFAGLAAAKEVDKDEREKKEKERKKKKEMRKKVQAPGYEPKFPEKYEKYEPNVRQQQASRGPAAGSKGPVAGSPGRRVNMPNYEKMCENVRVRGGGPSIKKQEWCNAKGPERHVKSKDNKDQEFSAFFDKMFDGNGKRSPRPEETEGEGEVGGGEKEKERGRPSFSFETVGDKDRRERAGRLNANRAALGIDGANSRPRARPREEPTRKPKPEPHPRVETEEEKETRRKNKFSDLDRELDKFKERADKEKRAREADDLTINTYESMWIGFEAMVKRGGGEMQFGYDGIPWLPVLKLKGPRGGEESWKTLGVAEHAEMDEKKAALRKETMRWHPDRFLGKFGAAVKEGERERIMEEVVRCSQRINSIRARFDAEFRREEVRREHEDK